MLDYKAEYEAGVHDATKDVERHGIQYAMDLIVDVEDPYVFGYRDTVEKLKAEWF